MWFAKALVQRFLTGMQNGKGLTVIGFGKAHPDTITNAYAHKHTHTHKQIMGVLWANTPRPLGLYWSWDQTDRLLRDFCKGTLFLHRQKAYGCLQGRGPAWKFRDMLQSTIAIITGAAAKAALALSKVCESHKIFAEKNIKMQHNTAATNVGHPVRRAGVFKAANCYWTVNFNSDVLTLTHWWKFSSFHATFAPMRT